MNKQAVSLAIATDFAKGTGSPRPYLQKIAEAGFTHIHWCHHSKTDFYYSMPEIEQIRSWLKEYGLKLLDLHGPIGDEKNWISDEQYEQMAGIELVKNRIEMTCILGGESVVMHLPAEPKNEEQNIRFWERVFYTFDTLEPVAKKFHIKIALENLCFPDNNFSTIQKLLTVYKADYLGICYDSGHGNITGDGLIWLEKLKERLIAVHLSDNNGKSDQHLPVFRGTIDWQRLTKILSSSSYTHPLSLEIQLRNVAELTEETLLEESLKSGVLLTRLMNDHANERDFL